MASLGDLAQCGWGGTTGHGGGNRAMFETVCPRQPDLHPTMGGLKKGPTPCMQL